MDFAICWLSLLSVHTKVQHITHTLCRRKASVVLNKAHLSVSLSLSLSDKAPVVKALLVWTSANSFLCRVLATQNSYAVSRAQNKVYVNCDHWGHSNRAVASYSMTVSQLYISLLIVSVPDSLRTACAKSLVPRLLCLFLVISIIFRVCVAKEWSVVQWTQKREQLGT